MMKRYDLTGKLALITGGGGLLGAEHSLALLECGADVMLVDIDEESLCKVKEKLTKAYPNAKILTEGIDITDKRMIVELREQIDSSANRVDILVNNAAIDPKVTNSGDVYENSRIEHFSLDQWNLEVSVGLTGAFLCSQAFGPIMAADGKGGVILNIASDLSVISPDQRLYRSDELSENMQPVKPVTYSVIKSGLVGLTRYLATYWSDQGVRCNALSPGGVFTGQPESFVDKLTSLIPAGRMAKPDEYHAVVQFLCSDASAYMNGQNVVVDGGRSVW